MSSKGRAIAAAVIVALLVVGGRWACRALASDETKIRRVIAAMVAGFNDTRATAVLDGLAADFRDRTSGATREDVRDALAWVFFDETDGQSHVFLLRAELVEDELEIAVEDGGAPRATVAMRVLVHRRVRGEEKLYWDARVRGTLEERDDGWQWTETVEVNHSERRARRAEPGPRHR